MSKVREESLRSLLGKIACVFRHLSASHDFPLGERTLSKTQTDILFLVARSKGGIAVKDLAKALTITSGAITQFIDALVEKKLVSRQEDVTDRRLLQITLTPSAQNKFKEFRKKYFKTVSPMFKDLNDEEVKQLVTLMNKINFSTDGNC